MKPTQVPRPKLSHFIKRFYKGIDGGQSMDAWMKNFECVFDLYQEEDGRRDLWVFERGRGSGWILVQVLFFRDLV